MTEFDPDSIPVAWGTYEDAERLSRWAFLRKTPEQRLAWLVEMLKIAYATGAIRPRRPESPEYVGTVSAGPPKSP